MFKTQIKDDLKDLFGFKKATFNAPSESFEQDTLFLEVSAVVPRISQGRAYARVTGAITVFAQSDRFPFGFFNKRILQADPNLSKKFFFYDIDTDIVSSPARVQNISERRTNFVYLYSAQYDPSQGSLTTLEGV